jgi:hypothetical protein
MIVARTWRTTLMGKTALLVMLGTGTGVAGVQGDAAVAAREVLVSMLPSLPWMTVAPLRPLLCCRRRPSRMPLLAAGQWIRRRSAPASSALVPGPTTAASSALAPCPTVVVAHVLMAMAPGLVGVWLAVYPMAHRMWCPPRFPGINGRVTGALTPPVAAATRLVPRVWLATAWP